MINIGIYYGEILSDQFYWLGTGVFFSFISPYSLPPLLG